MPYKYTLLKQDGTREDLGTRGTEMALGTMTHVLGCKYIELIPRDYYKGWGDMSKCIAYGDEEGRFNSENKVNPHFKDLGNGFNVVGNILMQQEVA